MIWTRREITQNTRARKGMALLFQTANDANDANPHAARLSQPRRGGSTLAQGKHSAALGSGGSGVVA